MTLLYGYTYKVYSQANKLAYVLPKRRENEKKQYPWLKRFDILTEYSNKDILILYDYVNVLVVIRGTDINDKLGRRMSDLTNDLGILFNNEKYIDRTGKVRRVIYQLLAVYPKNIIRITGFSLGGYVAIKMSNMFNIPAVLFNPASSPSNKETNKSKIITTLTTNNIKAGIVDPLSVSSVLRDDFKTYIVPVKAGETTHALNNFI